MDSSTLRFVWGLTEIYGSTPAGAVHGNGQFDVSFRLGCYRDLRQYTCRGGTWECINPALKRASRGEAWQNASKKGAGGMGAPPPQPSNQRKPPASHSAALKESNRNATRMQNAARAQKQKRKHCFETCLHTAWSLALERPAPAETPPPGTRASWSVRQGRKDNWCLARSARENSSTLSFRLGCYRDVTENSSTPWVGMDWAGEVYVV